MKINESKKTSFLTGKGYYPVLGICILAIGITAAAVAYKTASKPKTAKNPEYTAEVSSYTESTDEEMTAKTVSRVSDTRQTSSAVSPAQEDKKPETSSAPTAEHYILPVTGNILKSFSLTELQYSATYSDHRIHTGVDIAAELGTTVKSAGDGTVISAENDRLWGGTVEIDHGNGITGIYCGIDGIKVKQGDKVNAGTQLGVLGKIACESADAPHLHLAFKTSDAYLSPLQVMEAEK